MRKAILLIAVAAATLTGCKTTEANYKAAYDAAANLRAEREAETGPVADAAGVVSEFLSPVKLAESDAVAPALDSSRYYVAANRFKQVFNARALCCRLVDGGHTNAVVARSASDEYYVFIDSAASPSAASMLRDRLVADDSIPFGSRNGYPRIIRPITAR